MQEATLDCKTPWTAVRLVAKVWGSENGSRGGGGEGTVTLSGVRRYWSARPW